MEHDRATGAKWNLQFEANQKIYRDYDPDYYLYSQKQLGELMGDEGD